MKTFAAVLATILFLASSMALAAARDDSQDLAVSIDSPTGSMHCGFGVSGNIKSPKAIALSYGFYFRSELNIVTALDRAHPIKQTYFSGPGSLRVTASSKDFQNESIFQKHKFVQVQLRVWSVGSMLGNVGGGGPQIAPMGESMWVDVRASSTDCVSIQTKPVAVPILPAPTSPTKLPTSLAPALNTAPPGVKHPTIQRAP